MKEPLNDWVIFDWLSLHLQKDEEAQERAVREEQVVFHLKVAHSMLGCVDLASADLFNHGLQLAVKCSE